MPSMLHEGLLLLFRNRPTLAPELLRDALRVELPAYTEARVDSAELNEIVPVEYRADLVVLLIDGRPVFAIVVEVQLARDDEKQGSWPVYLTNLRARVGCPTALLVVAPDAAVARWAAQPIPTGHPGFVLCPLVVAPDAVPMVVDATEVARDPELAVLSAMAHGGHPASVEVARALNAALPGLDADRARLYLDLVVNSLHDAARAAFEALMQGNYEYQADYSRKFYRQGMEQGRQEGRQEGLLAGEVTALLAVLEARGLELDAEDRARIESCTRSTQLKTWIRRAVTARTAKELFRPARKPTARAARKR